VSDFLLELLSEEIPARMQDKACADLARLFADEIAKAGLTATAIETYATPRRLALIARGLPLATEAVREETKGPRASAPPQALEGFLRKTGLTRDDLVERDGVLFAIVEKPGRATADVLAAAIPTIIRAFPWPKSMRWGDASADSASLRWVRPLQGIVALLGDEVVPIAFEGIASGRTTAGHRFHHPAPVTIGSAADYAEALRVAHVILDQQERRAIIRTRAAELASEAGLSVVPDEGLVAENAGLTEWPVPLLGRFDPAFLEVPREVIQLTDAAGALAPAFLCTANIDAADGGVAIIAGNGRVLAARLSDARFFWEQDRKVRLEDQAKKLDQIVFHERLGTVADKVERVAKLARWLVEEGIVKGANPDEAEQAARLCKADLVTGMVGEFPELQGVIGGYYARAEGMSDAVADAIRDHYKPVGQGDDVPTAPVTVAVSLADKLDSLFAFFAISEKPTGSKDPFALRRAMLGEIALVEVNQLRFPLSSVFSTASRLIGLTLAKQAIAFLGASFSALPGEYIEASNAGHPIERQSDGRYTSRYHDKDYVGGVAAALDIVISAYEGVHLANSGLLDFFADRLKVQQREAGVRYDLIDAVFALGGEDDLVRLLARVKALQAFVATEDGVNLLAGYKRAANIVRIEAKKDADAGAAPAAAADGAGYAPEPAEAALIAALDTAEPAAATAVAAEDFEGAMQALARLRPAVDAFFADVTVNDPDPIKRAARLALLDRIRVAVHNVADFSKIEG
jgi:glycyl-tRNA synthetase beta chain